MAKDLIDRAIELRTALNIPDRIHDVNIMYILKQLNIDLVMDNSREEYDFEIKDNQYIILMPYYEYQNNKIEIMKQIAKISYMIIADISKKQIEQKYWLDTEYKFFAYQFLIPIDEFRSITDKYYDVLNNSYNTNKISEEYGLDSKDIIAYGKYKRIFRSN